MDNVNAEEKMKVNGRTGKTPHMIIGRCTRYLKQ